jgi:hypothetical protein
MVRRFRTLLEAARAIAFIGAVAQLGGAQAGGAQTPPVLTALRGSWIEDQAKNTFGHGTDLRFRRSSSKAIEELRGTDPNPVVQTVMFDGKSYAVDGNSGNTIVWTQSSPTKFQRQIFVGGKQLLATRQIVIAADGKTLTEDVDRVLAGGAHMITSNHYHRSTGEASGLVATWAMDGSTSNSPDSSTFSIEGGALHWANRAGYSWTATLDGKQAPEQGVGLISGGTVSLKAVDAHTLELVAYRNGVKNGGNTFVVSADGNTMKITGVDGSTTAYKKKR